MNLIEAIKSGKPFRKIGAKEYVTTYAMGTMFSAADLLSGWEIKQDPREWEVCVSSDERYITSSISGVAKIRVREILDKP